MEPRGEKSKRKRVRWITAFTEKLLTSRTTDISCHPTRNCCFQHWIMFVVRLLPPGTFTELSCAKPKTSPFWVASPTFTSYLWQAEVRPINPSAQETGVFTKSPRGNTPSLNPNRYLPIPLANIPRSEHEVILQSSSSKNCIFWSRRTVERGRKKPEFGISLDKLEVWS